jgi:hypothetical protein
MDRFAATIEPDRGHRLECAKFMLRHLKSEKFKTPHVNPGSYWVYCLLCSPAHNDLNSLVNRFGAGERIQLQAPLPDADYFAALSIGATAGTNTINLVPAFTTKSMADVATFHRPAYAALQKINAAQKKVPSTRS